MLASAVSVTSTPGALSSLVNDKTVTELTVSGNIDARDLAFIADELTGLSILNLSSAHIVAYSGTVSSLGDDTEFAANQLPARVFFGKAFTRVTLPSSLVSIGDAALAGCRDIATVNLPSTLQSIGNDAFNNSGVTLASIPASVTRMGKRAFSGCRRMTHAKVYCATLGEDAFAGNWNLSNITLGAGLSVIGSGAFKGTVATTITVDSGCALSSIGDEAFRNTRMASFNFGQFTKLKSIGAWAFANTKLTSVAVPNTVTSIGDGAFFYIPTLTEVSLPRTITRVGRFLLAGDNAVEGDSILMRGHKEVGDYAFYNWDRAERFVVSSSVEQIGERAFAGMTSLKKLYAYPRAVPQLGENVWDGVNQAAATLYVHGTVVDNYSAAAQWMDFGNILPYKLVTLDLNNDGEVDVADVVALANFVMGDIPPIFDAESADVNGDGQVDISDVVYLANIVMGT